MIASSKHQSTIGYFHEKDVNNGGAPTSGDNILETNYDYQVRISSAGGSPFFRVHLPKITKKACVQTWKIKFRPNMPLFLKSNITDNRVPGYDQDCRVIAR